MNDRLPPYNLEAERGVLGSVLLHPECFDDIRVSLEPSDFWRDSHRQVAATMWRMADCGLPLDAISVSNALAANEADRAPWDDLLAEMLASIPHAANATYYAGIVAKKATTRLLMEAAETMLADCYSNDHTADELVDRAEARLYSIAERRTLETSGRVSRDVAGFLEKVTTRRRGDVDGLPSGFETFDEMTGGFRPGELTILAARPSMGKTALALNVADAVSGRGTTTAIVSLEMTRAELAERLVISRAGVDGGKVRTGYPLDRDEDERLGLAVDDLSTRESLWIDDAPTRTPGQILSLGRRLRRREGLGLLIVDYLQLVEPGPAIDRRASRQEQVAAMSRKFKQMARDLGIPVLLLSQLNRQPESREDRRPRLSDLRESGAIEQDADVVLFVHRPEYYDSHDRPGFAELIVAKNRSGRTGKVEMTYHKSCVRFEDGQPPPDFGPVPDGEPF